MKTVKTLISLLSFRVIAVVAAIVALAAVDAAALPLTTYAESSRLASGSWTKISVDKSGIYILTNEQLRSMGITDPARARIYGYGATRLPDVLDDSYIDDLPLVQSLVTAKGVVFYAVGPMDATEVEPGRFIPKPNPFTTAGYYFVTADTTDDPRPITAQGTAGGVDPVTSFYDWQYVMQQTTSPGRTGHTLVGDEFLNKPSRNYPFNLENRNEADPEVWMRCSFMALSSNQSHLTFTANSRTLPPSGTSDAINSTTDTYAHYREGIFTKTFDDANDRINIGISFRSSGTVKFAALHYIALSYSRKLLLGVEPLEFAIADGRPATLAGTSAETVIWDVTSPLDIFKINTSATSNTLTWTPDFTSTRRYVAFNPSSAKIPSPSILNTVTNQDLHAIEIPDMVIFTPSEWISQAHRLAQIHADSDNPLKVAVVSQNEVFNEFSSGSPDANAFRKMLKMLYDRSQALPADAPHHLQYALFMGRGTYDNRCLTTDIRSLGYPMMPIWETDNGNSDTDSFTTDDIYAFLRDGSGRSMGSDEYCIAVGRMPVTSAESAKMAVDKILEYMDMPCTGWRNSVMILADDEDNGIHMKQAEQLHDAMITSDGGADISYRKLYIDAYERKGSAYPEARADMFKILDEGIAWWFFIGHANITSWTHEQVLTYNDINNLYLRHYPIVYAATCDFLRWDNPHISAAEIMWRLNSGGAIGIISANRPVYISDNGNLSRSIGRTVFKYNADNTRPTLGQIYMNAKNALTAAGQNTTSDSNKLRYVLLGDPALQPITPQNRLHITSINGIDPADPEAQAVIAARQDVVMEGYIADPAGNQLTDYEGIVASTLYDAEYSVTSRANGDKGANVVFEQQGYRLFAGNDSINNGRFKLHIAMPSEVSNNFRNAAISLYAYPKSKTDTRHGAGVERSFYVYGTDYSVADNEPPVIKSFYINSPTFTSGDDVNSSPMVIAEISDNRGLNMNITGIGKQMHLLLDGNQSFPNVADYYTPSTGDTQSGTISFPLENLNPGEHTLRLRIWDTSENSANATITFNVNPGLAPEISDIYADANPASTSTNFYVVHNRPEAMVTVTVAVYNMLGRPVWSTTLSGRSDMFTSIPINWDLRDNSGRRVPRGIYLYRATITADGIDSPTRTRRIAVTD